VKQIGATGLRRSTSAEGAVINHHRRLTASARAVNEMILIELRVEANGRVGMIGLFLQKSALTWCYSIVWHGDALDAG
jgi:hypothetical protein